MVYVVFECDIWKSKSFNKTTAICTDIANLKKVLMQLLKDEKITLQEGYSKEDLQNADFQQLNRMVDFAFIELVELNTIQ